jgi:agmatine deiminase
MITDIHTNKVYFSSLIKAEKYEPFWTELQKILAIHKIKPEFIEGTRDIWCRDYMPVQLNTIEYAQFKYFPDYCVDHRYIKLLTIQEEMKYKMPRVTYIKPIDLIVDGGNIVKCKNKAIMTEKVFKENKNRSEKAIIDIITKALKVDELPFIPVQPFDYTGHADGMIRFYNENALLVNDFSKESSTWRKKLDKALKQTGLEIIPFPYLPSEDKFEGEYTAKGCYINYAQIGNLIIFPQFKINEDGKALQKIQELYPEPKYVVETIDSNLIAREGGVLNCITWNIYKPIIDDAIDYLLPVYGDENRMLVVHSEDERPKRDTLCVQLSPKNGEIGKEWSFQKTMKHVEPSNAIGAKDVGKAMNILKDCYSTEELSDILEALIHPDKNAVDELVEIPQRLKNYRPRN